MQEKSYLSLKEQNCWLMTCQTISSEDILKAESFSQLQDSKVNIIELREQALATTIRCRRGKF